MKKLFIVLAVVLMTGCAIGEINSAGYETARYINIVKHTNEKLNTLHIGMTTYEVDGIMKRYIAARRGNLSPSIEYAGEYIVYRYLSGRHDVTTPVLFKNGRLIGIGDSAIKIINGNDESKFDEFNKKPVINSIHQNDSYPRPYP